MLVPSSSSLSLAAERNSMIWRPASPSPAETSSCRSSVSMRSRARSYGSRLPTSPDSRKPRWPPSASSTASRAWRISEIVSKLLTTRRCCLAAELECVIVINAPAATSTAIVTPMTKPMEKIVRRRLAIAFLFLGQGESNDDPHATPVTRRDRGFAAKLHGQAAQQRYTEATPQVRLDRAISGVEAIVFDDQLGEIVSLLNRLDTNFRMSHRAEIVTECAAHRLGHDQPHRNGHIGTDGHHRRPDLVARRGLVGRARHSDLAHEVADKLLEIDQRPARPFVQVPMQDRQGQHPVLGIAEEPSQARRAYLTGLQVEQAGNHLEIILHAMMDFPEHVVALLQARSQFAFTAGDRLGHLVDALADGDQLRCPGLRRLKLDILPMGNPAREGLHLTKRSHDPVFGANPYGHQACHQRGHNQGEETPIAEQFGKAFPDRDGSDHEKSVTDHGQHIKLVLQTVLTEIREHRSMAGDRVGDAAGGGQRERSLCLATECGAASIDEDGIAGRRKGAVGKGLKLDANRAHAGKLVVL